MDRNDDLECVLGMDEMKALQSAFSGKSDGMDVVEFTQVMVSLMKDKMKKEDAKLLFMRTDARSVGRIEWVDVATYLLMNRTRTVTRAEQQQEYTTECMEFKSKGQKSDMHQQAIKQILVHPRLPRYFTCAEDGMVKMWNSTNLSYENTVHHSNAWVSSMLYVPTTPEVVVVASVDRVLSMYDATTGETLRVFRGKRTKKITREIIYRKYLKTPVAKNPTEDQYDTSLLRHLRKPDTVEVTHLESLHQIPTSLGHYVCSGKEGLLVGTDDGSILLYDAFKDITKDTREALPCLSCTDVDGEKAPGWDTGHSGGITSLKIAPSIESIITSGADATIRLMSLERGCLLRVLGEKQAGYEVGHSKIIYNVAWGNETRLIASCGAERNILLWNPFITKPLTRLTGSRSPLVDVAFNEADSQMFSLSCDNTVRVWDIRMWQCVQVLKNKDEEVVSALAFDERRSRLLTGSTRIRARPMVKTSEFVPGYNGHRKAVMACIVNTRSTQLVSADENNIMVWDIVSRALLTTWVIPSGVTSLEFDSSESRLLTGTSHGEVLVWNYSNAQLLKTFSADALAARARTRTNEVSPLLYATMEKPVRMQLIVSIQGNKRALFYDDASATSQYFRELDMRSLNGVYTLCAIPPSTLLLGTGQGLAVLFTDQITRPVILPSLTAPCMWYSLMNGPLHDGISEILSKNKNSHPEEWVSVDRYIEGIVLMQRLHNIVVVCKGEGTIGFWSCPLEQVEGRGELFRFYATHKKGNAVNVIRMDSEQAMLYSGDVSGYVCTFDVTNIGSQWDGHELVINETHIHKVHGFRAFETGITCLECLELQETALVCGSNQYSLAIFTPTGEMLHQFGLSSCVSRSLPDSLTCQRFNELYMQTVILNEFDNNHECRMFDLIETISSHPLFCDKHREEIASILFSMSMNDPPLITLQNFKDGRIVKLCCVEETGSQVSRDSQVSTQVQSQVRRESTFRQAQPLFHVLPPRPLCHLLHEDVKEHMGFNTKRPNTVRSRDGLVKQDITPKVPARHSPFSRPFCATTPPDAVLNAQRAMHSLTPKPPTEVDDQPTEPTTLNKKAGKVLKYAYPISLETKKRLKKTQMYKARSVRRSLVTSQTPEGFDLTLHSGEYWRYGTPTVDEMYQPEKEEAVGNGGTYWKSDTEVARRRVQIVLSDRCENDKYMKYGVVDNCSMESTIEVDDEEEPCSVVEDEVTDSAFNNFTESEQSTDSEAPERMALPSCEATETDIAETEKRWFEEAQRKYPPTKRRNRRFNVSTTPMRALVNLQISKPVHVIDPRKHIKKQRIFPNNDFPMNSKLIAVQAFTQNVTR